MIKLFKNPVLKTTEIEGVVQRGQLPLPPKGYDWYLADKITTKKIVSRRTRTVEKYRYVKVSVKVERYRYVKIRGKRKRRYYTTTIQGRKRRYYTAKVPYEVVYKRKYTKKWWVLRKKIKPPVKEEWIPTSLYLKKRYSQLGLSNVDIEEEKAPPFEWIEFTIKFNFYTEKIPESRLFDLIFIYYIVRISTYEVGKPSFRYVILSSSFDLGNQYPFYQVVKKFVPMAIETTKRRILKSKKKVDFMGYVCFGGVTKRELEEGKY